MAHSKSNIKGEILDNLSSIRKENKAKINNKHTYKEF